MQRRHPTIRHSSGFTESTIDDSAVRTHLFGRLAKRFPGGRFSVAAEEVLEQNGWRQAVTGRQEDINAAGGVRT